MKKILGLLVLIILMILTGCNTEGAETSSTESSYQDINVTEAKKLIEEGISIIDVRTEVEYNAGHIPNSVLIPLDELGERVDELIPDEHYLIVCRSGNRSSQASQLLYEAGLNNIYNMTGGMNDWSGEIEMN